VTQDFYGKGKFAGSQSAQVARDSARLRTLMYARMDGKRAERLAELGYGMPDQSGQGTVAGRQENPFTPVAQQVGGKVGSLLAQGLSSLLGGGFKAPSANFWPAASNIGNSTWQTGFSLGGSLLK